MAFYLESRIKLSMLGQIPCGSLACSWMPRVTPSLPCLRYLTFHWVEGGQWHWSVIFTSILSSRWQQYIHERWPTVTLHCSCSPLNSKSLSGPALLRLLFHFESEQTCLGTAYALCIVTVLSVKCITTFVQGVNLRLAFGFVVWILCQTIWCMACQLLDVTRCGFHVPWMAHFRIF